MIHRDVALSNFPLSSRVFLYIIHHQKYPITVTAHCQCAATTSAAHNSENRITSTHVHLSPSTNMLVQHARSISTPVKSAHPPVPDASPQSSSESPPPGVELIPAKAPNPAAQPQRPALRQPNKMPHWKLVSGIVVACIFL